MNKIFFLLPALVFFLTSCANSTIEKTPVWYISPKANSAENLYGVAEGYTLEEATKYALADAAARLMVNISSESKLIREENNNSVNEEMRQQVRQSVEKISFTNFRVSRSEKSGQKFYIEVAIERSFFIRDQHEKVGFLERKISDLDKNSAGKNAIQRRNALLTISDLGKELELKSRIIAGAGENINLKEKLNSIANYQNQLAKFSDKIEFYFEINSPNEVTKIIRSALNKEKLKIAASRNSSNPNQVVIKVRSNKNNYRLDFDIATKLKIDFENFADEKLVASNEIEVTGHSTINEKESYLAALSAFEEKISQEGILKIIGITN
jgi:hypothetical protein